MAALGARILCGPTKYVWVAGIARFGKRKTQSKQVIYLTSFRHARWGSLNGYFGNKSVELDFEKKGVPAPVGKGDRQM